MKTIYLIGSILLISLVACHQESTPDKTNSTTIDSLALSTITLQVNGMSCEGCEMTITSSLEKLEGVKQVKASHLDSTTLVVFDTTQISIDLISEKIGEVGYSVVGEIVSN